MIKEIGNIIKILRELKRSNYTALKDYAGDNQKDWYKYRKTLRDLPKDPKWPDVKFPDRPPEPPLVLMDGEIIEIEKTEEEEDES